MMAYPPIDPKVLAFLAEQEKRRKAIVVNAPNDPRLRAYQDSLQLHKDSQIGEKYWNQALVNFGSRLPNSMAGKSDLYGKDLGFVKTAPKGMFMANNNQVQDYNQTVEGKLIKPIVPEKYHKYETGYVRPAEKNERRLDDYKTTHFIANYKKPEQPVVYQKPVPVQELTVVQKAPPVPPPAQRTPAPSPIQPRLAPTNISQPLPQTQPALIPAVIRPTQEPMAQPPPQGKPVETWGPGNRYSLKDEKVRQMLKVIERLKK